MRHFSLMKLLTVSSFSTSADCLTYPHHNTNFRSSGRGQHLHQTLTASVNESNVTHVNTTPSSRRQALHSMMGLSIGMTLVSGNSKVAGALDMDAFMNSQVSRKRYLVVLSNSRERCYRMLNTLSHFSLVA
jgi:hypothetical protein